MATEYIVQALTTMQPCPVPAHWTIERQRALKPVLLLSTLDAIEKGIVSDNFVIFDAVMRERFNDWWSLATHMQTHDANFHLAFFHLADEPFGTLVDGECIPIEIQQLEIQQPSQFIGDFLASRVAGAVLDPSLFALAQDQQCRRTLMTDIVVSQFPLQSPAFGRLWTSLHNPHTSEYRHETAFNKDEETTLTDLVKIAGSDTATGDSPQNRTVLQSKDVVASTTQSDNLDMSDMSNTSYYGQQDSEFSSNVEQTYCNVRHLSLLPPRCVEALDAVAHDWRTFPLITGTPVNRILKMAGACGLRILGDLWKPSPLSILVLAAAVGTNSVVDGGFWATAYEAAQSTLAEVAETTVFELLRRAVPEPSFGREHALSPSSYPTAHQHAEDDLAAIQDDLSALFFSVDDIINSLPSFGLVSHQATITDTPVGQRMVPTRGVILGRLPLLSLPVRTALQSTGCPLAGSSLAALQLTTRTENALHRLGALNLTDLVRHTSEDLLTLRQFGRKAFDEVLTQLRAYLEPWLSLLSLDLLAPIAPPPLEDVDDDTNNDMLPDIHTLLRHAPSSNDEAAYAIPFTDLARWFDESPLPALLASAGMDWRELRLGDVLGPTAEWGAESSLLDETLCGFLHLCMIAAVFVPWTMAAAHKLASDLRDGLIRLVAARLASAHDDSLDGDESREKPFDVTLSDLLDILNGPSLADLRPRELQVLYARLGLRDGSPATLAETGDYIGVTRERARQLEKRALDRLATEPVQPFTRALGDLVWSAVLTENGAATIRAVADRIASWLPFGELHPEATTRLLAAWAPETASAGKDVLVAAPYTSDVFDRTQSAIRQVLQALHGISHDDLIAEALASGGESVIAAGRDFVAAVLRTMPDVALRGEIYQPARRGALQARVVQALRSLGRPAHFTEIAAKYRELFSEDAERTDNSIHAFFDRFPETFVLVGSGIFALTEWGYDPRINSVPTLVEHILKQSRRPLHVDEVIEQAIKRYLWKTNSISAQLSTNPRICPFGNGFFGLKNRNYGKFDSSSAYEGVFGESRELRERLVVGSYTNTLGHRVVQIRLTPATLSGAIRIVSRPLLEILPNEGTFLAICWSKRFGSMPLHISRSHYDLNGLGTFFALAGVRAGDYLFIEQFKPTNGIGSTADYLLAVTTSDEVNGARKAVGLGPESPNTLDARVLHYVRDPERVASLVTHTLAHPWTTVLAANEVLGYAPGSPYGADYLRLALAGARIASGLLPGYEPPIIRPTPLGRRPTSRAADAPSSGRLLALSLPAYRQHLRSIGAALGDGEQEPAGTAQLLGEAVTKAWDTSYGIRRPAEAREALATTPCLLSSSSLDSAPLTQLVLLILVAQSHGQGITRRAFAASDDEVGAISINRLSALGIASVVDDSDHMALAERVNLAVACADSVAAHLREDDSALGHALADAWLAVQGGASPGRPASASDLYAALELRAPSLLHALLVPAPAHIPEQTRCHDAELFPSGFTALAADWGLTARPDDQPPFAFLRHADALARKQSVDPVAICLSHDLLAQTWDAPRHLAANAHLALLVLLAGDLADLADLVARADAGWSIAGEPLLPRLDGVLRALGFDVWDDIYRDNPALQATLAEELVALGGRLSLLQVSGSQLEAVGSLASTVYYSGYDVLARIREALALPA